jgi:hypothetical protein
MGSRQGLTVSIASPFFPSPTILLQLIKVWHPKQTTLLRNNDPSTHTDRLIHRRLLFLYHLSHCYCMPKSVAGTIHVLKKHVSYQLLYIDHTVIECICQILLPCSSQSTNPSANKQSKPPARLARVVKLSPCGGSRLHHA